MNNPFCPPFIKNVEWFKNLINSYEKCSVFYNDFICKDQYDLKEKKNKFQNEILLIEYSLKKNGNPFALSFISGACGMCEETKCNLGKCNRHNVGRIPICGTGIELDELCKIIKIDKSNLNNLWRKYKMNFENEKVFFLSIIFQ